MNSQLSDLIDDCAGYGIEVFYGRPYQHTSTDFYVEGVQCMMEYCELHDIISVFFDCRFEEVQENFLEQIKGKLNESYKNRVNSYLFGVNRLPHIAETFFEPVLKEILKKLEEEYVEPGKSATESDPEDEITSVYIWAFHQGMRLYTEVEFEREGQEDTNSPSQKEILEKYKNMLLADLNSRRMESYKENQRIERIKQQAILDEIAQAIQNDNILINLTTVKARTDYADRLCAIWQIERGHEWLTKKSVRSLVELEYANRKMS